MNKINVSFSPGNKISSRQRFHYKYIMDLKAFTVRVLPNNSVLLSSRHDELFLSEREMIIKFGVQIPKSLQGQKSKVARRLLETFVFDYNNSLVLKGYFQKKISKK